MFIKFLTYDDINDIDTCSSFSLYKALYNFEYYYLLKDENNDILTKSKYMSLKGKRSTFIDIFYTYKYLLKEDYIYARKQLYRSMYGYNLKNLSADIIVKNNRVIFYNYISGFFPSFSEIIHIHGDNIDIFCKNGSLINISRLVSQYKLDLKEKQIKIFFLGCLLQGASENENEPLWFGELNNGQLDSSKPIYYLIGDKDSESQLLKVYIGNNTLIIRNYSILDSSLGIKLDVKSEEAKQILSSVQHKRQQQEQSSSSLQSTAMLCPVLEDDVLMCPHGGQVQLKSNKGKPFKSNGVPLILEPDLINAPISGCSNNILGVPTPCTMVAVIPLAALSMKKLNGEKAVMQDYASMIMTDKGVPLQCIPKPNKWKLLTAVPTGSGDGKESKESVEQKSHILLLRYNMLNTDKVQVISSSYENRENAKFNKVVELSEISVDNPLELDYSKLDEDDDGILDYIYDLFSQKYLREHYTYKLLTVVINYAINEYVLLIPKGKSKLLKGLPKEKQAYGIGRFIDMAEPYGRMVSDNFGNDKYVNYLSITGNVFKTGIGMEKLRLVVGQGVVMSKTDKKNKENKDIINLMVLNKDFSYNKTEYYLISSFSSTQYTSEIHKYYKNEYNQLVFERETPTVKQDIGIYIPSENSIQTDGQQDNKGLDELSTQEKEELVIELFETNDIINKLDVYLEDFRKFIENLSKDSIISDYRFLETIYVHANERIKLIKSQLNSELENLQTLDDSLVRNIIYQELVNIIKDMLLDFLSGKIEKLFRRSLELLLRFAGCTFFGILFIIYELLMIGMSIYEKYKKYKDAKEGFIIGKKFYALYIFYNYLDVNLAYIITENNTDNVLFTKTKDEENDLYFIDMYTFTNKLTLLSNLEYYSGLNYIDRRFKVTFRADSDLFNNSIFSLDNIIQENSGIYKNKNSCVQLSTYNGVVDICDSSYYNHIKSLIFNADKFTFIQTSNYCSLVIDKFIKTSYKLSDSEIIDNKYSIIISNKAAQNDLRYRIQSEINWKQKEYISKNLVFFSIKNNYKISSFFNYYCQFIRDFTLKLEKCLNEIMNFNEDDIKLNYLYIIYYDLFCSEIFNYRSFLGIIGGDLVSNILYFFDIEETDDAIKRFNKRDKSIDSIIKICDTFFTKFNKCCSEKIKDIEYTVDDILLFLQKPHKVLETINKKENNQVVKTFFEIFSELYLFMVDLNSIASYFYNTNISAEDSIKLYNAKKMFKEEVRAFFKRDLEKDAKINTFTILFKSVKLDKVLHAIYMQVIDVLYSKSFVDDKENFIKNLMKYICGDSDSDSDSVIVNMHYKPLSDIIDDYLMIYEKFAIKFNTYSTCSIPITLYQINKTFAKEIIYTMIYDEVSDMFPISRNNFDYILYDKKYYILLSEYIYYKHLMENPEYFNIITLRFATKITEYVNKIASNNITDLYNFYYILIMYVHCFIGNINVFDNCVHETIKIFKDELLKFNKKVLDKFDDLVHDSIIYCLFNDYNIEFSIKDIYDLSSTERKVLTLIISSIIESLSVVSSPITEVFNMANITKNTMLKSMEFFRNGVSIYSEHINNNPNERRDVAMFLQSNRNAFKNTLITLYNDGKQLLKNNWHDFKANFMQVLRQHTHQERSMDFTINFGENFRNLRSLYGNGMLAMCSRESNITLTSSIRIHDNESLNAVSVRYIRESLFNVGSRLSGSNISDNNTNSYNINHILLDSDGVSNMFEQHINLMNTYLQNYTNNMRLSETTHLDVSNIDNINQASATLRDRSVLVGITSNNETHVYNGRHIDGSAHFSSTVSVETNRNEQKFAKQLFGLGLNFIADTVIETYVFDVFFSIIDKKEYESKLYAIKYAYVNKISNIHGAEWNINHDYFTLPKQINQNFIMSDFRAMVVGGAHFDNSCFIKGTSSGIFVQDNEKVTRSFLEIILDYIDVVEEQQLDVKMGKYLVAYYKVINYLYEFHNYYSMSLDKLNILYDNLSRIEEFINSENLIQKKNGVDNENTQKINNNDSQYMDNLLMKDFVVQLKRIGESNYKFYETQKPGKEEQVPDNNNNSTDEGVQQEQTSLDNGTATATATATTESDNNSGVQRTVMEISSFEDDEMPVLLGSLIYDESWFKSTIDDE